MKKVNKEGGAGLQDWLSYQSRTREVVQPETDVIDWDEGIEVQEEWLPRELCEQRLREEAERKLAPAIKNTPAASAAPAAVAAPEISPAVTTSVPELTISAVVEVEDVPLAAPVVVVTEAAPEAVLAMVIAKQPETRQVGVRESSARDFLRKMAAPTQFELNDLASAVPAFHR